MNFGFCYGWVVRVDRYGRKRWETSEPQWRDSVEEMLEDAKRYRKNGEWKDLPDDKIKIIYFREFGSNDCRE